jgi:hypothetical protein
MVTQNGPTKHANMCWKPVRLTGSCKQLTVYSCTGQLNQLRMHMEYTIVCAYLNVFRKL